MNLQKKVATVRAGHGQDEHGVGDPGAVHGTLKEDDITLKVVLTLKHVFSSVYQIIAPRKEDVMVTLADGVRQANSAKSNFFLSIHCNSSTNPSAHGVEAVYASKEGKVAAEKLSAATAKILGLKNRGAKFDTRGLYELHNTKCPAVILELGFLSNDEDRPVLAKLLADSGKDLRVSLANELLATMKTIV